MSTTARADHLANPVAPVAAAGIAGLDAAALNRLAPSLLDELCRRVAAGALPVTTTLDKLFIKLCGSERSRAEQLRFLFFVAPVTRRIAVASVRCDDQLGSSDVTFAQVKSWLQWLDGMDPMCARMVDLYYFAGLSVRETAAVLRVSPKVVVRELRFARSWLSLKVPSEDAAEVPAVASAPR
jgi:hypothetical protein